MESVRQPWVLYALGSALFAALTATLAKIGIKGVNADVATAVRTVVILLIAWGIVFARGVGGEVGLLPAHTVTFLALSGVATGLSWICYFRALQIGPTGPVAAIDKTSLVLVVLFSALVLHEPLTWRIALGAGLITVGTIVLIR
jgi:transporter family protein